MTRISVIVAMYNIERYVEECIQSLRSQTFPDFEVVCVNDGSTDESLERAKRAADGDARFKFVTRPNGGLSAARNTGLDSATGDYVCFLDGDDCYAPHALQALSDAANRNNLDLVDFSAQSFYDTREARRAHEEDYDYRDPVAGVHDGQTLFTLYMAKRQFVSSACFHLIRRSMLDEAGLRFFEGIIHEDELFTPQLYAHAKAAAFLDEGLYLRRVREGSIMTAQRGLRNATSLFVVVQSLHAWLIENAETFSPAFIDALALDLGYLHEAIFRDLGNLDETELEAYLSSLTPQQRIALDLAGRMTCIPAHERLMEIESSRAYKLGGQLSRFAQYARDHAKRGM